ncbi:DUF3379 domain-containing protein [Photobacterium makurazakiensis]|uniref:DUF3379 family protein n=1 Tax=Photobacterium makurazakiensis TaxID=2910234 RepID=UPI003D0993AC
MKHKVTSLSEYRARQDAHEHRVRGAVYIDVPKGLSSRLLDIPNEGVPVCRSRRRGVWGAGLALIIMSLVMFTTDSVKPIQFESDNYIPLAMNHISNQGDFLDDINERVTLEQVNMKLAPFGSKFEHLPGQIYYVNHCNFGDETVFQMIVGTTQGERVSVYLVPKKSQGQKTFDEDSVSGVQTPYETQSLVVISDDMAISSDISQQMKAAMKWDVI